VGEFSRAFSKALDEKLLYESILIFEDENGEEYA